MTTAADLTSGGPATGLRAVRSPAAISSAAAPRSRTGAVSRSPIRSPTNTEAAIKQTATPDIAIHDDTTPWSTSESGRKISMTAHCPWLIATGWSTT